jgi:hypothetical protein
MVLQHLFSVFPLLLFHAATFVFRVSTATFPCCDMRISMSHCVFSKCCMKQPFCVATNIFNRVMLRVIGCDVVVQIFSF